VQACAPLRTAAVVQSCAQQQLCTAVPRGQYAPINRDPANPESVLEGDGRSHTAGGPPDRVHRLGTHTGTDGDTPVCTPDRWA